MSARALEYNGTGLVVAATTLLCITWVVLPLRAYVRIYITKTFALEDWFIVLAQLIFTCMCASVLVAVHYGVGRHKDTLPVDRQTQAKKYQTLATIFYVADMMFIKISIAVFLLRIAVHKRYIWILRISILVICIWSTAIFLFEIFQCIPVQAEWDKSIEHSKCVSANSFVAAAISISIMTIVSDWLYALLPIPMIWKIKMSVQAKVTVTFILSLGIFASIAPLIRIKYILELEDNSDSLFTATNPMIWTLIEPAIAITAACLVTMRPLLIALHFPGFSSNHTSGPYLQSSLRLESDLRASNRWTSGATATTTRAEGFGRETSKRAASRNDPMSSGIEDGGSEEYILDGITTTVNFFVESEGINSKRNSSNQIR